MRTPDLPDGERTSRVRSRSRLCDAALGVRSNAIARIMSLTVPADARPPGGGLLLLPGASAARVDLQTGEALAELVRSMRSAYTAW